MRKSFLILGLVLAVALGLLWASGSLAALERTMVLAQREAQNALAGAVRRLRAGEPGAVLGFLGISFAYGFFHAAGPGHGKMLIGGYGMASRVRFGRLALIAVAASLAQAAAAILLVYAGLLILGWGRDKLVGVTEGVLTPISYAAVASIGLWLVWRGLRSFRSAEAESHPHDAHPHDAHPHDHAHHDDGPHHDHDHVHDAHCGHSHGPTIEEVARVHGLRDALALIGGVAMRPCSGALLVLVLTWQLSLALLGIAAAIAMGVGTATLTLVVAGLSVWAREGALATLSGPVALRAAATIQILAGAVIALAAGQLLFAAV